jgi:hypothetical protein
MEVSGKLRAPAALPPGGRPSPILMRLSGPQSQSGRCEEKNTALLGIEPEPFIPYPVAIPTQPSRLPAAHRLYGARYECFK